MNFYKHYNFEDIVKMNPFTLIFIDNFPQVSLGLVSFVSSIMLWTISAIPRRKKRIAVIGLTCLDIHACPVESLPEHGGVSFIENIHLSLAGTAGGTAVTIAKLTSGDNVDYFGSIGDDFVGKLLIKLLETFQIDPCHLKIQNNLPTSATVINVRPNGERPCLHRLGASDYLQLSESDIKYICKNVNFIHIGGMGLQQGMPCSRTLKPLLEYVHKQNNRSGSNYITIIMDLIAPHSETLEILTSLLPFVDYFMPSLEEAEYISGCKGSKANGMYFMKLGVRQACIFKDGGNGSFIFFKQKFDYDKSTIHQHMFQFPIRNEMNEDDYISIDGNTTCSLFHVPAVNLNYVPEAVLSMARLKGRESPKQGVLDTTGCGDNYCAGFIAGLIKDYNVYDSMRLATVVAGLCATGVGSDAGNIDFEYARLWMDKAIYTEEKSSSSESSTTAVVPATSNPPNKNCNIKNSISDNNNKSKVNDQQDEEYEFAIKERDFYLEKLRDIESFLKHHQTEAQLEVQKNDKNDINHHDHDNSVYSIGSVTSTTTSSQKLQYEFIKLKYELFKILYETKEGFGVEEPQQQQFREEDGYNNDDDEYEQEIYEFNSKPSCLKANVKKDIVGMFNNL